MHSAFAPFGGDGREGAISQPAVAQLTWAKILGAQNNLRLPSGERIEAGRQADIAAFGLTGS